MCVPDTEGQTLTARPTPSTDRVRETLSTLPPTAEEPPRDDLAEDAPTPEEVEEELDLDEPNESAPGHHPNEEDEG